MARAAAFQADRSMFKRKRPALISVTLEAARLVGIGGLNRARELRAVRIVAIDASHRAFWHAMLKRFLETCPDVRMALGALLVHVGGFAGHQALRPILMDGVAGHATDLVFGVGAVQSAHVGRLIEVAGEAD